MVEEFMLLANTSVAKKIVTEFPECSMLRRHPEPPQANFDPLVKAGRNRVNLFLTLKELKKKKKKNEKNKKIRNNPFVISSPPRCPGFRYKYELW